MLERSESAIALTKICCRRTEEAIHRLGLPLVTEQKNKYQLFRHLGPTTPLNLKRCYSVYTVPETNR